MAEAFELLVQNSDFKWNPYVASEASSCIGLLDQAVKTASNDVVSLWFQFSPKSGADPDPDFYAGMDEQAHHFSTNGAVRVVALVELSTMQAMTRAIPAVWRSKSKFLAWPEAKTSQSQRSAPQNEQRTRRRPADGSHMLSTVEEKLSKENSPLELAGLHRKRSQLLADAGRLEEARKAATQAARIYRDNSALDHLAESYELLSSIAERSGALKAARDWMTFALESWELAGQDERIAECHAKKGHLHYLLGDKDTAAQHFQLAIARDEAKGRSAKVAAGLRRLGLMAEESGRFKIAVKLYTESMVIVERLGDRIGLSRAKHHLGRLAERTGNYVEAFEYHKQSLELKEVLNDTQGMASSYHHLGNTYYRSRDLRAAHQMYLQALDLENELNDHHGRANTLLQLALVQSERFDWESALIFSLCAHHAWRRLGMKQQVQAAEVRIQTAEQMVKPHRRQEVVSEAQQMIAEWDTH
jgi:tetratricopeptide (TPR) repeat protein